MTEKDSPGVREPIVEIENQMNRLALRSVTVISPIKSGPQTGALRRKANTSLRSFSADASSGSRPSPYIQGDETHFGFQSVGIGEKEAKVRQVFESVADSYDIMNDVMSAGLHRYWKDYLLDISAVASMAQAVRKVPGNELRILDVAGGTGDIAFRFIEAAECPERSKSSGNDVISVTVCDINREMLRVGEKRARERFGSALLDESKALSFVEGNVK